MRALVEKEDRKAQKVPETSVAYKMRIPAKDDETYDDISFEEHPDANPESRTSSLKRIQQNPLPNWGPKMKAHASQADIDKKRKKNQGKHSTESKKPKVESAAVCPDDIKNE